MAICMDDILIKGSFSPQMYCYAPGTTLLFLALDWCLIWERDISFPNLQATHFLALTHLGFVLNDRSLASH